MSTIRHLVVVLGDQLDLHSPAFAGFDKARDLVWMAEVAAESTYVLSHKVRIAYFLSSMRHFAAELRLKDYPLEYRNLEAKDNRGELQLELATAIEKFGPQRIVTVEAGEYRIQEMLKEVAARAQITLEMRPDTHFLCTRAEFGVWAKGHKQLRMEYFYREMRKKTGVLMDHKDPVGGKWNYDSKNRNSFGKQGPGLLVPAPTPFKPDAITNQVLELVERRFATHPGSLAHFDLPVSARDAEAALGDFVAHRLAEFGSYQDAMWTDQPFLYHSRISAAMNLKLLNPRRVLMAVEDAYHKGNAPLSAVEGFIRQILGWREYVRGIYWLFMPDYLEKNALNATEKLPDFYWDGKTEMNCLKQALSQTLEHGYAHHIQRLMVTGLFALLFGVDPIEVHKWYLAVYWDAVEWVELPNTTGMSQYADGGIMASKPYVASGKYISRMSNYCQGCRYKPDKSTGADACPFTTLYWDFLLRHEKMLEQNPRMMMQVRNVGRLAAARKKEIRQQAADIRANTAKGNY